MYCIYLLFLPNITTIYWNSYLLSLFCFHAHEVLFRSCNRTPDLVIGPQTTRVPWPLILHINHCLLVRWIKDGSESWPGWSFPVWRRCTCWWRPGMWWWDRWQGTVSPCRRYHSYRSASPRSLYCYSRVGWPSCRPVRRPNRPTSTPDNISQPQTLDYYYFLRPPAQSLQAEIRYEKMLARMEWLLLVLKSAHERDRIIKVSSVMFEIRSPTSSVAFLAWIRSMGCQFLTHGVHLTQFW